MRFISCRTGRAPSALLTLLAVCLAFAASKSAAQSSTWKPGSGAPIPDELTNPRLIDTFAREAGVDTAPLWDAAKDSVQSSAAVPSKETAALLLPECRDELCDLRCKHSSIDSLFRGDLRVVTGAACDTADWCRCDQFNLNPRVEAPSSSRPGLDFTCAWRSAADASPGGRGGSFYEFSEIETYGGSIPIAQFSPSMALTQAGFYTSMGEQHQFGVGLGLEFKTPVGRVAIECFFVSEFGSTDG